LILPLSWSAGFLLLLFLARPGTIFANAGIGRHLRETSYSTAFPLSAYLALGGMAFFAAVYYWLPRRIQTATATIAPRQV